VAGPLSLHQEFELADIVPCRQGYCNNVSKPSPLISDFKGVGFIPDLRTTWLRKREAFGFANCLKEKGHKKLSVSWPLFEIITTHPNRARDASSKLVPLPINVELKWIQGVFACSLCYLHSTAKPPGILYPLCLLV